MTPSFLSAPLKSCYANIHFLNAPSNVSIRNTTLSTSSLGGGILGELLHYHNHYIPHQNTHEINYTPIE
ncbi:hypothetical protein GIB67_000572 [Kingdonia uniflora]|uniref:Uncharacterized protein n=1 Tax=Kingdonia uniflora TaxID=39325 RepID=A0A7J7MIY7_9MAGN|nr:hypothetical protein GIB67_000572 [Kingdonia uniflora]